jgi:hypothetical protein
VKDVRRSRGDSALPGEVDGVRRLRDQTFLPDVVGALLFGAECEALALGDLRMLISPLRRTPPASDPITQLQGEA